MRGGRGSAAGPIRVLAAAVEPAPPSTSTTTPFGSPGFPTTSPAVRLEAIVRPVVGDMEQCRQNLLNVVGERHPLLLAAADQIFSAGGKRLRPLLVVLVSRATAPSTGLR